MTIPHPEIEENLSKCNKQTIILARGVLTLARGSAFTMHVKTSRSPGPEKTALCADDTSGGSENKYVLQLMTMYVLYNK